MRLQRQRAITPDLQILGPRELMRMNKSRQKIEFEQSSSSKNFPAVEINLIPPTPTSTKKRRHTHNTVSPKKAKSEEINESEKITDDGKNEEQNTPKESQDPVQAEDKSAETQMAENKIDQDKVNENTNQEQTVQSPTESEEFHSAINENVENKSSDKTLEAMNKEENEANKQEMKVEQGENSEGSLKQEIKKLDQTPLLMDESIISVPESPAMISTAVVKDSTFSPEVDTSIKDTRPHIDSIMTPIILRNVTLRTSTPLHQRVLIRDTPKLSEPVISALKKVLVPKAGDNRTLNEESFNETFNGQFKMGNPLEKSILKSSRRKRSLSVTDGESFMQKKVAFMSPEIMNIDTIDEKMLQSFKEEMGNSMLKQVLSSGGGGGLHRKRSLSESGTPAKAKIKVPNFKAIHEQQFKRMESIVDHAQRKAERAKRLATPSKLPSLPEIREKKSENGAVSKIPTRKPLAKVSSSENILHQIKNRTIKRSNSAETRPKPSTSSKIPTSKETESQIGSGKKILPRILDANTKVSNVAKFTASSKKPTVALSKSISKEGSSSQSMRAKVEERRERNMSLYKGNAVKAGLDHRKKNENVLKGVRLNRRFELQMQHRRMEEGED